MKLQKRDRSWRKDKERRSEWSTRSMKWLAYSEEELGLDRAWSSRSSLEVGVEDGRSDLDVVSMKLWKRGKT